MKSKKTASKKSNKGSVKNSPRKKPTVSKIELIPTVQEITVKQELTPEEELKLFLLGTVYNNNF